MTAAVSPLDRAREELGAAEALLAAGFPSQALCRAYLAALRAAEAALLLVDDVPSTPAGVVSAFGRRVVVQGGLDPAHGRALRRLYEDRRDVDHALADAPPDEARRAIREAQALVDATALWIAQGGGGVGR
jgi:uncharacterized protein (UPF0332 family)